MICAPTPDLHLDPRVMVRRPWAEPLRLPERTIHRTLKLPKPVPAEPHQLEAIDEDPERWDGLS
jgi:hypothetical protein